MKRRLGKVLLAYVASTVVLGAGPMISTSFAADTAMPAEAMPAADPAPSWWFHGEIEAGGRFFLDNPQKDGIASQGGKSLGKYYEYRDLRPGPFGNGHLAAGTTDGLYQLDIWGENIGYDDQRFDLDASKAGQHYFHFRWDETPHNYGIGHTIYDGVGSNALALPAGLSNQLHLDCAGANPCANPIAARQHVQQNLHDFDLGIRRDTASVDYRWTPTDAWDIQADYSNMHRSGTQTDGVVMSWGTSGVRVDAAKPVDDTTHNFDLSGEYAGASPWGQKFNFKLAYNGSLFIDGSDSYTVQNPFCATGAAVCDRIGSPSGPLSRMSLWPDNQVNGFSANLGADLPIKSRYTGTVSYTMMRQNQNFLPFTINPNLGLAPNGQPWNSTAALPAASLNGAINTLLSDNVLTTRLTPELKSKLSYRYYSFDNDTPEILFPGWVGADINAGPSSTSYKPVQSISISYTKQNAGADLNWRPSPHWSLGAAYGYERYSWTRADADVTNENSGKVYADWKPVSWITGRASYLYSERRFDNYDYLGRVGLAQWQGPGTDTRYSTAYRQFYLDNRDRNKAQTSLAVDVLRSLTITPTFGLQYDDYRLDRATEVGLLSDHALNAGAELAYAITPDTRFLFSYLYEHRSQVVSSAGNSTPPFPATAYYTANVEDKVNTFIAAFEHALISNRLDIRLAYTLSLATVSQPLFFANGTGPSATTGGQYPDMKNTFQRFEAVAKYTFDDDFLRRLGWTGKLMVKLGYAFERNTATNYQIDIISPYSGGAPFCPTTSSCGYMLWNANDNPNYNVHRIAASLTWLW